MSNKSHSSKRFELHLFDNGIDSIKEGINCFIDGREESRKFKYAVLNIYHGVELILKERLARIHPLLIYTNIDADNVRDTNTVSLGQIIKRLRNTGIDLDKDFIETIKTIQTFRNCIQHYKFELDVSKVEVLIGKVIKQIIPFLEEELDFKLQDELDEDIYKVLLRAVYSYEERLKLANKRIAELLSLRPKDQLDYEKHICPYCDEEAVVISLGDRDLWVTCQFCRERSFVNRCERCENVILLDSENYSPIYCDNCLDYLASIE